MLANISVINPTVASSLQKSKTGKGFETKFKVSNVQQFNSNTTGLSSMLKEEDGVNISYNTRPTTSGM